MKIRIIFTIVKLGLALKIIIKAKKNKGTSYLKDN